MELPRSTRPPRRIAVLGAGITGLTAAWHLQRAGLDPVVFEPSARAGGAIGAVRRDGWLHELGPNSLLEGSAEVATFIDELGLGPRRLYAGPEAKQRYIVRAGRLVAVPASPGALVTTKLFSWRAKLALLGEPWRRRSPADAEESVAEFVVRRLGREFLDYAINPFVGGVYAGDPERLSVRHAFPKLHALEQEHGSLIRGAWARRNPSGGPKGRIFSFPDGLEELPLTLARALGDALRLNHRVLRVGRTADGWRVEGEAAGVRSAETFAAVVCALPAGALAGLTFENVPGGERLALLREIEHPPVASVFTGYRRDQVAHPLDGFGVLVPQVEHRRMLGTLFSSTLFPGRAPAGHVGLTTFVGGVRDPQLTQLDDAALLRVVQGELEHFFGAKGAPVYTHIQRWPRAIPQYTLGYQRFKDAVDAVQAAAPGLLIGGNARDGISLAQCIESGRRLADAVAQQVAPTVSR
jgi:oxygen-dependent protoporphyrinogen oxidase